MRKILKFLSLLVLLSVLTACHFPSWLTYTNTTYQFQLQYPPGGSLVSDTPTSARIQLPITPGTNLVEKYLDIFVNVGAIPCLSPYSDAYGPPPGKLVTGTQTINGIYWVIESASEGAAGSFYQWTAYSTFGTTACVSLTFVLHSHNPDVYLPTVVPTFDPTAETSVFLQIVDTFEWLGLTPYPFLPLVTLVPAPLPTFTPTGAPPFFTPHLNAYCRHGPDPIFDSFTLAMKGQAYPIVGRNMEGTWFLLRILPNVECWVPSSTGEASGETSGVRVMPQIETPTFTPPPAFNCGQFTDPQTCSQHPECTWNRQIAPGVCQNK